MSGIAQTRLAKGNIDEVVASMTTEEKVELLVGRGRINYDPSKGNSADVIGAVGGTKAIERLGIPATVMADGPAGVRIEPTREGSSRTYYATSFPVGTNLASSWDVDLVRKVTAAMAGEFKEYGIDVILGPGMNINRNPLCGRNFEYYSEDPVLSGKIGAAYIEGAQSKGIGTSIKHFFGNNQETNRDFVDSRMSQRAMREIYLRNFEIAIKESKPWTVMASYNKVNGVFSQQSSELLTTVLRDEWGYNGLVVTDWGCKDGTVEAALAGDDLMEPGEDKEVRRLLSAVEDGRILMETIDRNVRRVLEYIVKTPGFASYKYSDNPDLDADAALVREAGAQGLVLLKNDGVLPMKDVRNVALYGTASYKFFAGGLGSGNVHKKYVKNIQEGLEEDGYSVDAAISSWYRKYLDYTEASMKADGQDFNAWWGEPVIPDAAVSPKFIGSEEKNNDIAIITIGRNAGEGTDRTLSEGSFLLTSDERRLLENVCDTYHAAGKKVIVVLNIDGVIETASWKQLPDAILCAWGPGMEGGASVADVLSGRVNPSGKLPVTFPVNYFDNPSSYNFPYSAELKSRREGKDYDYTEYDEGIYVGYRYFTTAGKEVSYPFGYGLSYTAFEYSHPQVKAGADGFTASITVKNTGSCQGKEVVEVYVSAPLGGLDKPVMELKAFAKTKELKPGESQTLTFDVDNYSLASFRADESSWESVAGDYTVIFASSSEDVRAKANYRLKKTLSWKVHNVLAPEYPIDEIDVESR